jgi:hypothetical protein
MRRRKSLEEILELHADLDLLSTKDALEACKEFLIHEPTRAMIMEENGLCIHLVSKRHLIDSLVADKGIEGGESK